MGDLNIVDLPCVLIVSSSNIKPKSLIKLIAKQKNDIPEDHDDPNNVTYIWRIDTKYYTTSVNLHGVAFKEDYCEDETRKYIWDNETGANSVEALIVHMDSNKKNGLKDVEDKFAVINQKCNPDIKILLCNYCTNETKIDKQTASEWCIKNGYELIELYPKIDVTSVNEEDVIIEEKFGVDRVIEVLHAHVWTNLKMKNEKKTNKNIIENQQAAEGKADSSSKSDMERENLEMGTNADCFDDFTELFSQLHTMKESIQSIPLQNRKQCAEQIVTAFWKAIGGDEDEIADL